MINAIGYLTCQGDIMIYAALALMVIFVFGGFALILLDYYTSEYYHDKYRRWLASNEDLVDGNRDKNKQEKD